MQKKHWVVIAVTAAALAGELSAQAPPPQIPAYNFRSPEDTRKFGMKPEDIKAGVKPDYSRLREQLIVIPVRGQIYLIAGAGGNIAMQVGDEGVLLVDTGVAAAAQRVVAAYKDKTEMPLRWIIDTSFDADHTGANAAVAATGLPGSAGNAGLPGSDLAKGGGAGASIVAFETVANRMYGTSGSPQAIPVAAWPTTTFFTPKKKLYFNEEPIEILHQPAAHGDGDVMVYFRISDVIATGDAYCNDRFPQFDPAQGGHIDGAIDSLNRIIDIAVAAYNMQGGTLIVPGHGRIANLADVVEYRDGITIIRDRIKAMVGRKMRLAEVKAAGPALDYERTYTIPGWTGDQFVEAVYNDLSRAAVTPAPGTTR